MMYHVDDSHDTAHVMGAAQAALISAEAAAGQRPLMPHACDAEVDI